MIRFGLLGAGTLGEAHAESIARLPNTQLAAVADPNLDAGNKLAKKAEAPVYASYQPVIEQADIDAIVVASPTPHHFEQAKAAIQAGKHLFLEMPAVRHLEEGEELLCLAQTSNRVLFVGHTLRGYAEYQKIKQAVADGAVGNPGVIHLHRRTPHPRRWYSNHDESGGVVLDAMTHEIDFLRWCFGPVKRVYCQGLHGRQNTDKIDYALAVMRLASGAIAHLESSWCHYGQFHLEVEIAGDKGVIQYSNLDSVPLHLSALDLEKGSRQYAFESPVSEPAHYKIFAQFVQAIENQALPADKQTVAVITLEEGVEAVRVAHACIESMRGKRPIAIQET